MSHEVQRNNVDEDAAVDASKIAVQIGSLDTARASGAASYVPRPIVVDDVLSLPKWFLKDTELIAAQLHYDWCCAKYVHEWRYGAVRDDAALVDPCLMPMRELPKGEQEKNVRCVVETMKCVVALGCHLRQPKSTKSSAVRRREVPLMSDKDVTLCWETMVLVDLLAENAHEVWADGYVRNGWRYGSEFDAENHTHPSLKPYMTLDEQEKDLSRDAVTSIFKACLCLGYQIKCSRRRAMS
ncbi:Camkk protein kinase, partial [Globisporangium splendens]